MKKILLFLLFLLSTSVGARAQIDEKVDSLKGKLELPARKLRERKYLFDIVDRMKIVAAPTQRAEHSPNQLIAQKEKELEELQGEVGKIETRIKEEETAQAHFEERKDSMYNVLLAHERLILTLVNDKFKLQYDPWQMADAQRLLKMVKFDKLKDNVDLLVVNYGVWMKDIEDILEQAKADFSANPRRWDAYGGSSQADVFIAKLNACDYMKRKDKNWKIAYLDEFLKLAKSRISLYKDKTKRGPVLDFSDIPEMAEKAALTP